MFGANALASSVFCRSSFYASVFPDSVVVVFRIEDKEVVGEDIFALEFKELPVELVEVFKFVAAFPQPNIPMVIIRVKPISYLSFIPVNAPSAWVLLKNQLLIMIWEITESLTLIPNLP